MRVYRGPTGAFIAVAAYLFDKNIDTVYYTVYVYRDRNSSQLRPVYRHLTYFYEDAARTIEIEGNPVETIITGT